MVKNIGTPALLPDNASLHPENCRSYKCFGIRMFIYFVCIEKTLRGKKKKSQIWYHSTQNSKNGLDKMIGTLNLIFGCTPFGKNNWDQSLPVTIDGFLTPLYWNFGPLYEAFDEFVPSFINRPWHFTPSLITSADTTCFDWQLLLSIGSSLSGFFNLLLNNMSVCFQLAQTLVICHEGYISYVVCE